MSEESARQASPRERIEGVSRRLQWAIGLRAALAPFRATLQALGERAQEPEGRRQLLALWRPCQERLDVLVDAVAPGAQCVARIDLLRHEIEDHLVEEAYSLAALADLSDALDQACEVLLLEINRDLQETVARVGAELA